MKNTILVIGGAGYIGSHVNKMLQQAGYNTLVLDNLSRGNRLTIQQTPFIQGCISDNSVLQQIFERYSIDTVMHFAALCNVAESVHHPAAYYQNNFSYTLNLLNSLVKNQVKYVIFSSTAAIFGHPQQVPICENHPCAPINPYGTSKLMVEKILKDFHQAYGLRSCSIRYFNAAGGDPEGKIKYYQNHVSNLIPLLLKSLKSGNAAIKVNGTDYPTNDGTCVRDYVHIEDLGAAHLLCMEKLWATNESCCYNLGTGKGYSVKEVIYAAEAVTGKKIKMVESQRRPGDPAILVANANKAIKELNWQPQFNLEAMIEHAWKAMDYL